MEQSGIQLDDLALNDRIELLYLVVVKFCVAAMDELLLLPLLQLEFRNLIHGDDADRVLIVRANFWASILYVLVFIL